MRLPRRDWHVVHTGKFTLHPLSTTSSLLLLLLQSTVAVPWPRLAGPGSRHSIAQRVGPFSSVGGYDWWTLTWYDVSRIGSPVAGDPWRINAHWAAAVDAQGVLLPLHQHHSHLVPSPAAFPESFTAKGGFVQCVAGTSDCPNFNVMAQQHGDTEPQCYGLDFGESLAFQAEFPIMVCRRRHVQIASSPISLSLTNLAYISAPCDRPCASYPLRAARPRRSLTAASMMCAPPPRLRWFGSTRRQCTCR